MNLKKAAANVSLFVGVVCIVSAIWTPQYWWQFLATGVILLFTGAALSADKR